MGSLLNGWSNSQHRDTKRNRYLDLHHFAVYVLDEDLPPKKERDDTRAATVMLGLLRTQSGQGAASGFLEWLEARNYSPATKIRKIKTLRLWARYLYDRHTVPRHLDGFAIPSLASLKAQGRTEPPSDQPSTPDELSDVAHLSTEGRAHAHGVLEARDQAIVDLLAHSSLGHAQLLDLTWKDVDFGEHPVREDDTLAPPARIQVPRRDGRKYWRHLAPHATRTLRVWKRAYVSHFCAALPDRPVFSTLTGQRLSPSRLYQIADG